MNSKPTIVDLFCGCGGFGLGAELAGFHAVAAVDIDATLQSSYKRNFPNTRVINDDLSTMDAESWKMILNNVSIDGVIGGPPCQGYSRMGKSDKTDPRRSLLRHFFRNINLIRPKFFIMENVEGLMDKRNAYELEHALKVLDKNYTILEPMIIDASKYGAPTKRKRVIVIGYDSTQVASVATGDFYPTEKLYVSVKEAISDLPLPIPQINSNKDNYGWANYIEGTELSHYAQSMRALPTGCMGWSKSIKLLKSKTVSGYFDTRHTKNVKKRYQETKPGSVDSVSRAKKLAWDGLCPTLRAGTGSDKGSHQAVRPLHPEQSRVITVREAARLQGFPDWFVFHPTKWHSFRMIGNSVSPIVSKYIMHIMKKKLKIIKPDISKEKI